MLYSLGWVIYCFLYRYICKVLTKGTGLSGEGRFLMVMPDFFDNEHVKKAKELFEKVASLSIFQKSPSTRFLIIAFCCIIGVLLLFSAVSVISEGGGNSDTQETTEGEVTEVSLESTFEQQELESNCLFVLTDNDKEKIHSLVLVRLDSVNDSIRISFIDPDTRQSVGNQNGTMHRHLRNGGVSELVWAVTEKYKISIERYLMGDEADFTKLMSQFGNIEIDIESQINHEHNGVSFIIESGRQTLTPDMMLKYFLYLSDTIEQNTDKAVKAMLIYASHIFGVPQDVESPELYAEEMKETFENLLGFFETDISAVDYARYNSAMQSLYEGELISKVSIVADPASFSILNEDTIK